MRIIQAVEAVLLLAASTTAYRTKQAENQTLPVVDLGYELYRAASFNETGQFYNFSNIRYSAKPVRFGLPKDLETDRSSIRDGSDRRVCPQSGPAWIFIGQAWLNSLVMGTPCKGCFTPYIPPGANWNLPLADPDPREMEDCLFLDVFVPEKVLKAAGTDQGAAVLVYFPGGGYTWGRKEWNPAGLLAASGRQNLNDSDIIYISANYRLGAMGFSSGPTFQSEGGIPNLGLIDQRFALEWVQKYVHLFGGDKDRVTIFGESSGGGSILHQITAYGGKKGPVPFRRAVPQSAGFLPRTSPLQQEKTYQLLLQITNTSSLSELRNVSEKDFIKANSLVVGYNTTYGDFIYSPVVDGDFTPKLPGELLAQGAFDKSVEVLYSLVEHEGDFFAAPYMNSSEMVRSSIASLFPYMDQSLIDHAMTMFYPPIFNGSYGYTSEWERAALMIGDLAITCNGKYLSQGLANKTYSYFFAQPPSYHGIDNLYTYYDGGAVSSTDVSMVMNRTVAITIQQLITSFAKNGVPTAEGVSQFRTYGADAQVLRLSSGRGFQEVRDGSSDARCAWWQNIRYS
ncbi:acetylcholinesterase precursor [Clohesyomyces aquaticus]|uniref:Carboxylic ester hydrolase n=1 Tax=Clohesyomyces aquaticus TaxID=1231657 RepID=A0A1Y1ZLP1_9PLEO|nr:acetylcholinesterase precursor [Clohesyomyces aquaticus]